MSCSAPSMHYNPNHRPILLPEHDPHYSLQIISLCKHTELSLFLPNSFKRFQLQTSWFDHIVATLSLINANLPNSWESLKMDLRRLGLHTVHEEPRRPKIRDDWGGTAKAGASEE